MQGYLGVEIFYGLVGAAIKLSFLLLYRRIFTTKTWFKRCLVAIGVLVVAWSASVIITTLLQCRPISANWRPSEPHQCISGADKFYLGVGVCNVLLDIAVFLLPIPVVWPLNMPTKKKIFVISTFGLGTL